MTFEYNGNVINGPTPPEVKKSVRVAAGDHGVTIARTSRIIVGALVAGLLLYYFVNNTDFWERHKEHVKFWQTLIYSGFFFVQAIAGESICARAVKRGAIAEQGSPVRVWLVHFATVELPAILLSFAEIFLIVALGAVGLGSGS